MFEELATCAHDMKLSIANTRAKDFSVPKMMSEKNENSDTKKITNNVIRKSMVAHDIAHPLNNDFQN